MCRRRRRGHAIALNKHANQEKEHNNEKSDS
jgi:hypothetical protein